MMSISRGLILIQPAKQQNILITCPRSKRQKTKSSTLVRRRQRPLLQYITRRTGLQPQVNQKIPSQGRHLIRPLDTNKNRN